MCKPRVGVLMPVFNSSQFLGEAISSILNQSYKDFDFYIINDGSTDDSEQVILSFKDPRIIYLKNESNKGLIYTLNRGLDIIDNEYIIRMDSDDIALPQKFEKQVMYMDSFPELVASGTQIEYFGQAATVSNFPLNHSELRAMLVFAPGIVHPTAIIRTAIIRQNNLRYDPSYVIIEDYEFWLRVSRLGKLGNLQEVLLKYRWEGQNITARNWDSREERYKMVYGNILSELGIEASEYNKKLHLDISFNSNRIGAIRDIYRHKQLLIFKNRLHQIYPEIEFKKNIDSAWRRLFFKAIEKGLIEVFKYFFYSKKIELSQLRYLLANYYSKLRSNKSTR